MHQRVLCSWVPSRLCIATCTSCPTPWHSNWNKVLGKSSIIKILDSSNWGFMNWIECSCPRWRVWLVIFLYTEFDIIHSLHPWPPCLYRMQWFVPKISTEALQVKTSVLLLKQKQNVQVSMPHGLFGQVTWTPMDMTTWWMLSLILIPPSNDIPWTMQWLASSQSHRVGFHGML